MREPIKIIDIGYEPKETPLLLIVDDEHAIQGVIFDALENAYRIVSASNGRDGVEKAQKVRPALILMDMMMPDMGGYEAVKLLQANPITKKIPVVIMTAQNFDESTVMLIKQEPNVYNFLPKPFRARELREIIPMVIKRARESNNL